MEEWARGVVWDCTDPDKCIPVQRSSRDTRFPGRRQVDSAVLRAAAAELRWDDEDIVGQAGGEGMKARSACELITVLAFHHPGLLEQAPAAAKAVAADLEEEW
eukprot:2486405-Pleurochrysis_carterae.AAC.1